MAYARTMPLGAVNAVSSTGGMSLSGAQHWNYQGKGCSKDDRARAKESNAQIRLLELIAIQLGMIPKKR